ncbi:MAG TPA: PRC-barrel domain-containing protein [Sphingomicrobium sp.]|nr:PRC-barrel domain-containing protein [Sphingomicrobium sp.]
MTTITPTHDRVDQGRDTDLLSKDETRQLISSDKVEGTTVFDRTGEKLGTVRKLMIGKLDGQIRYVVMGFGGLFGMGEESYPLPWDSLEFDTKIGGYRMKNLVKDDLDREKAPSFPQGKDPDWSEDYDRTIRLYYFRTA